MSFLNSNYKPKQKILAISLRTTSKSKTPFKFSKRTSPIISRASVTIETALAFPLFLLVIVTLLSFLDILRVHVNLETGLHQTAREMAVYGHAAGKSEKAESLLSNPIGSVVFGETYVRNNVLNYVGKEYLDKAPISNGSKGISFLRSKIMEEDMICLMADYQAVPMIPFPGLEKLFSQNLYMSSACKIRAFTGYDNTRGDQIHSAEEMVFITETGSVYHTDRSCSHLTLTISMVNQKELVSQRNEDGGRYYACERCNKTNTGIFYITNFGNRYHTSVRCSGLKRTIEAIPVSQVGTRAACSRCGRK